jgi:hypothetical protein
MKISFEHFKCEECELNFSFKDMNAKHMQYVHKPYWFHVLKGKDL